MKINNINTKKLNIKNETAADNDDEQKQINKEVKCNNVYIQTYK